jgi:hypothetical protein
MTLPPTPLLPQFGTAAYFLTTNVMYTHDGHHWRTRDFETISECVQGGCMPWQTTHNHDPKAANQQRKPAGARPPRKLWGACVAIHPVSLRTPWYAGFWMQHLDPPPHA